MNKHRKKRKAKGIQKVYTEEDQRMRKTGRKFTRNLLLSALTTAMLVTASAMPAFATEASTYSATVNKVYTLTLPSGGDSATYASPAESFTFTSGENGAAATTAGIATLAAVKATTWNTDTTSVQEISSLSSESQAEVTSAYNVPQTIQVGSADYAVGGATTAGAVAAVNLKITGSYAKPGVYYYDFHEAAGTTAGVTYNTNNYRASVTVENQNGSMEVTSVKLVNKATGDKVDKIDNSYGAGLLTFTKKVSGNMGDTNKKFDVTVTLTAPEGKAVSSVIAVTGTGNTVSSELAAINPSDWSNGTVSKTFTVEDGTTISLANIPEGVTCLVKEADYSADGYKTTYSVNGASTGTADSSTAQNMVGGETIGVTITNTNDTVIDTGVFTSNLPYIMLLAVAAAGAVAFIIISKKRRA